MNKGAKSVRCIATHGILSGKAFENLENSVMGEVLVSDTIAYNPVRPMPSKLKYISCANLIAKSIWSLSQHKSIHEINIV